jgi:hypothetical protein
MTLTSANAPILQSYANFFGSLWHAKEISHLTVFILSQGEVQGLCGENALACYSPAKEFMILAGEATRGQASLETTAAHEFGHHLATHRNNDPWKAVDWGPKRWATYMGVCRLVRQHRGVPRRRRQALRVEPR